MGYYHDKKPCDRKWIAGDEEHDAALAASGISVDALSRVSGRPTTWLVQDVIPDEAVTLVAGAPGSGKTFFACQLAADAGRELQHRVVFATAGYERPELLRWRLDQAEGDARRVVLATLRPQDFYDRRTNPSDEMIDERLAVLYHTLEATGDPTSGILPAEINLEAGDLPTPCAARLLIIDDVDGWFGKPGNMLSAAALARILQRLDELARSKRVAIVVLARSQLSVEGRITSRHLSRLAHAASVVWMLVKDREQGSGTQRVPGVQGSAEEVLGLRSSVFDPSGNEHQSEDQRPKTEDPSPGDGLGRPSSDEGESPRAYRQSQRRWLLPVKNNLSADGDVFGRSFELVDGQMCWHLDDPAPELSTALLPSAHNRDRRWERRAAAEWIEEALAEGPIASNDFYAQASECGFSKATVLRAAGDLGLKSHKTGFKGGWEWRWTPRPVVRGRGSMARAQGAAFRVVGYMERGRVGEEEMGRGREGVTEGQRDGVTERESDGSGLPAPHATPSCAPSAKCEESRESSCAPSLECEENGNSSCAPSPQNDASPQSPATNVYTAIVEALQEPCIREAS